MDDFFRECKNLMDKFRDIIKPYEEAVDELYDVTKFYEVPGASMI